LFLTRGAQTAAFLCRSVSKNSSNPRWKKARWLGGLTRLTPLHRSARQFNTFQRCIQSDLKVKLSVVIIWSYLISSADALYICLTVSLGMLSLCWLPARSNISIYSSSPAPSLFWIINLSIPAPTVKKKRTKYHIHKCFFFFY